MARTATAADHPRTGGRRARTRRLVADERGGFAPVELVMTAGFWLIPLTLLVASLPTWVERQSLGRAAAAEAARVVVLAPDAATGTRRAQELVAELARNHRVPAGDLQVVVHGDLARGGEVSATTTVAVPALSIPLLSVHSAPFTLRSTHVERVDDFRSFGTAGGPSP